MVITKWKYFLKLTIVQLIILTMDYLFEFFTVDSLAGWDFFWIATYFKIPAFIIFIEGIIVGIVINDKNLNFFKSHQKTIAGISAGFIILLTVILTLAYEFGFKGEEDFFWSISFISIILSSFEYPLVIKQIIEESKIKQEEEKVDDQITIN